MPNPLLAPLLRWFGRLSYPKLFLLTAALFVGDTLVPDSIPFVDEIAARPRHPAAGQLEAEDSRSRGDAIDGDATPPGLGSGAMLVDSHCHLDAAEFDRDRAEVIARARAPASRRQIVPAIDAAGWPKLRDVCARRDGPVSGLWPASDVPGRPPPAHLRCTCATGSSANGRSRSANAGWISSSRASTTMRSSPTSRASWSWRANSTCRSSCMHGARSMQ